MCVGTPVAHRLDAATKPLRASISHFSHVGGTLGTAEVLFTLKRAVRVVSRSVILSLLVRWLTTDWTRLVTNTGITLIPVGQGGSTC